MSGFCGAVGVVLLSDESVWPNTSDSPGSFSSRAGVPFA